MNYQMPPVETKIKEVETTVLHKKLLSHGREQGTSTQGPLLSSTLYRYAILTELLECDSLISHLKV